MTGVSAHSKPSTKIKRGISRVGKVNSIVSVGEPFLLVLRRAVVAFFLRREDGMNSLYPANLRSTERINVFPSSLESHIILH